MFRKLLAGSVFLTGLALFAAPTPAQQVTTGAIEGTVTSSKGDPLAGARVTITSQEGAKSTFADDDGQFRFPYLTAGTYDLVAGLEGYSSVQRKEIRVSLGSKVRIEVVLSPGVTEDLKVTAAAPTVDLSSTTTGATIDARLMSSLPIGRTFSSTLAIAPGVVGSGIDESNPSIGGASGLENTYIVDGVNITDTGYGSAGSYSITFGSLGTGVNFDYVQEVQVKTGGYEPEYGQALGGFINLVTKSGGNDLHWSVFTYLQPTDLEPTRVTTDRVNATADPKGYTSRDYGFDVGGPIVRDKAFFYAAVDPTFTTRTRRTAQAIRENQGIDNTVELDRNVYNYAGNIKWLLSPKHTLNISAFGDPSNGRNGAQRAEAVAVADPSTRFSEIKYGGHNVIGRWDGTLRPNWFVEGSVAYHQDRFEEIPQVDVPNGIDRRTEVPVNYGGVGFYEDSKSRNIQYQVKLSNFIHEAGEHNLRYGVSYDDIGYDHTARYTGPSGITLPDGSVSSSGFIWDIKPDSTFRISRIRSGSLTADTRAHYLSLFLSDSWNPIKSVNIMAGIRYEEEKIIGNLSSHKWGGNWGPRAHVTWDPTQDNKSKVSFSFGRFFGKVPNDLAVRALSSEVTYVISYPLSSVDLSDPDNPKVIGPHSDYYTFGDVPTRIDSKSKLTYQDEYVVSAEREIRPSFNLGLSYTHRKLGRTLEDTQLTAYSDILRGTEDFGEYFITNPTPSIGFPTPSRKYDGVTLKMDKRFQDDWQVMASYTWSRLKGNYEGYYRRDNGQSDPFITSLFDFPYLKDPDVFKYAIEDGLLPNDRTHVANLYGSYRPTPRLNLGLGLKVQSGVPKTRLGFNEVYGNELEIPLEPRGASGRGPVTTDLSLHADYSVKLGPGLPDLRIITDVFNLLNQQNGDDFEQASELGGTVNPPASLSDIITPCPDCANSDFGKPISYQTPRQFVVALRASF